VVITVVPIRKRRGRRQVKFRYDPQSGALYIRLRAGQIYETLELAEGAYLNIDIEGRVLGAVFLSLEDFAEFASRQGKVGVELPRAACRIRTRSSWT
jgi:uncharacterized protein YuzE